MSDTNTQNLAERIALLLQREETERGEFALLRAGLEQIGRRLDRIESQLAPENAKREIPDAVQPLHASQQRFHDLEALADQIINSLETEKPCPYEPTSKPCDNCSMCSSRGF